MTERRPGLRVGTRRSPLALWQAREVIEALQRTDPRLLLEVRTVFTAGDRGAGPGGSTDFTGSIERMLEQGELDLAVHSAKDLPTVLPPALRIAACLPRADPRDALVLRSVDRLVELPDGARIGSSSARRKAELLARRPDLRVVEIRGNVDTRLERMRKLRLDGLVLACAGLDRLGRSDRVTERLDRHRFLPAPGQGAIAVETRKAGSPILRALSRIDHAPTRQAIFAERECARALGADCDSAVGILASVRAGRLTLRAAVYSSDGARCVSDRLEGPERHGRRLAQTLARRLLRQGAGALLEAP